jgi:hypothetical protein
MRLRCWAAPHPRSSWACAQIDLHPLPVEVQITGRGKIPVSQPHDALHFPSPRPLTGRGCRQNWRQANSAEGEGQPHALIAQFSQGLHD